MNEHKYIIYRADHTDRFDPFDGEELKVYGPYSGNALKEKIQELIKECKTYFAGYGYAEEYVEVEESENGVVVHNGHTCFYIYSTHLSP